MEKRFISELGKELVGERLKIWDGTTTNKTPEVCAQYRQMWLSQAAQSAPVSFYANRGRVQHHGYGHHPKRRHRGVDRRLLQQAIAKRNNSTSTGCNKCGKKSKST